MHRFKQPTFLLLVLLVGIPAILLPALFQARATETSTDPIDRSSRPSFQLTVSGGLVSLEAKEAGLSGILEELSRKTGVEIVMGAPVDTAVTVSFQGMPLDEALAKLTRNRGIVFSRDKEGGTCRISKVVVLPSSGDDTDARTNTAPPIGPVTGGAAGLLSENGLESPSQVSGETKAIFNEKADEESPFVPNELIVRFRRGVPQEEIDAVIGGTGATVKRRLNAINYCVLTLPACLPVNQALKRFRQYKGVETVEPNYVIPLQEEPALPDDPHFRDFQWNLHNTGQSGGLEDADIDALEAWEVEQGSPSVVIAVIDTGVDYAHPDLAVNIWENNGESGLETQVDDDGNGYVDDTRGWDFVDEDNDPMDEHGHGTHVAGIAGAVANNGVGVAGVVWNCRIMPVRAGDSGGLFTSEHAAMAIIYAAENRANVINLSWGGYDKISLIDDAMGFATAQGALICAAAGNDNSNNPVYPAATRNEAVIAVGATDDADQKALFSNYGDWVQVSAPGDGPAMSDSGQQGIFSTFLQGGYRQMRGTSMATPHVSGTAALLFSLFPDLSAIEAKTQIMRSVDVLADLNGTNMTSGRVNAYRALTETYETPFIFSVTPRQAHEGDRITILGDKFGETDAGASSVTFDPGLEAEALSWSNSAIVCQVPHGAETGDLWVTTPGGTSNKVQVTLLATYYNEALTDGLFLGAGAPMGWHADDRSWEYVLPFSFPFFGRNHETVHVCSNGFLVFDDAGFHSYDNDAETLKTKVMIAPLWDDLVTTGSAGEDIYLHSPSPDSVCFRWEAKRYGTGNPVHVEAVLYSSGDIEFNYGSGNANLSPTVGISAGRESRYHLGLYDGAGQLENAETVVFTPVGFPAAEAGERDLGGNGNGGSPCFIATAAFGSPLERHVRTLRQFRVRYLESSSLGRLFVRVYEACSPPVARFISRHETARRAVRLVLLPWVAAAYALLYFRIQGDLAVLVLLFMFWQLGKSFRARRSPG
jgi:subtilisin family serine protease